MDALVAAALLVLSMFCIAVGVLVFTIVALRRRIARVELASRELRHEWERTRRVMGAATREVARSDGAVSAAADPEAVNPGALHAAPARPPSIVARGGARQSAGPDASLSVAGDTPSPTDYAAAEAELRDAQPGDQTVSPAPASRALASAPAPLPPALPPPRRASSPESGPVASAASGAESAPARIPEADPRPPVLSLEDFLGARVLLVAGVVIVLFALGFFMKFAIERELIAPPVRVAVGAVGGIAALFAGDRLRARGFGTFGHTVMGGGLGALFISTFFAAARYELIGQTTAFGITAVICAFGTAAAVSREAPLLAYLGFVGGYVAPSILGTNVDSLEGLTGWLLLLHGGVLAVLWLRRWPGLDLLALASSCLYYAVWAGHYLAPDREGAAALSLVLLTAAVLAAALAPSLRRSRVPGPTALVTAILCGTIAASAGFELFYDDHRYLLGAALVALAVVYSGAAWRVRRGESSREAPASVLAGCAVAAVAAAVPALLASGAIAPAWAAFGVVAAYLAARQRLLVIAIGGVAMIALAQIHLGEAQSPLHSGPYIPFVNGEFFAWASPAVALVLTGLVLRWKSPWRSFSGICLGVGAWVYAPLLLMEVSAHFLNDAARYGAADDLYGAAAGLAALGAYTIGLAWAVRGRRPVAILAPLGPFVLLLVVAGVALSFVDRPGFVPVANALFPAGLIVVGAAWMNVAAARGPLRVVLLAVAVAAGLGLIATECVAIVENSSAVGGTRDDVERLAQMASSVATALYGATLLGVGFARRTAALRWSGLAVFALTIAKVFIVDTAQLPALQRVGAFLVLGLALLGASFLYQRARRPDARAS